LQPQRPVYSEGTALAVAARGCQILFFYWVTDLQGCNPEKAEFHDVLFWGLLATGYPGRLLHQAADSKNLAWLDPSRGPCSESQSLKAWSSSLTCL